MLKQFVRLDIQAAYRDLADRGVLPYVKHGDIMLYTIGTGYVLWMASIETQSVRKGYQSFLSGLTGGRYVIVHFIFIFKRRFLYI